MCSVLSATYLPCAIAELTRLRGRGEREEAKKRPEERSSRKRSGLGRTDGRLPLSFCSVSLLPERWDAWWGFRGPDNLGLGTLLAPPVSSFSSRPCAGTKCAKIVPAAGKALLQRGRSAPTEVHVHVSTLPAVHRGAKASSRQTRPGTRRPGAGMRACQVPL